MGYWKIPSGYRKQYCRNSILGKRKWFRFWKMWNPQTRQSKRLRNPWKSCWFPNLRFQAKVIPMDVKTIKDCARKALEVGNSLDRLNLSGFGKATIFTQMDDWSNSCHLEEHYNKNTKILVEDGLSPKTVPLTSRRLFLQAKIWVLGGALSAIEKWLKWLGLSVKHRKVLFGESSAYFSELFSLLLWSD